MDKLKNTVTGRFQDKSLNNAEHYVVRISRGAPRFSIPYAIEETCWDLAPSRDSFGKPASAFKPEYEAGLNGIGAEVIARKLTEIEGRARGRRVVLACFCDVESDDFCHRTLFRGWFHKRTGQMLEEIQPAEVASNEE